MPYVPTETPPADDDELPYLERLTESGVWEFYQRVKVQQPPKERSSLAERLWSYKPKPVQLDD